MTCIEIILNLIAGTISGFLITYLSDVLPITRRLSQPVCSTCSDPLSAADYLIRNQCPSCGNSGPKRWIIVISSIIIVFLVFTFPFASLKMWATIPMIIFLGTILSIDYQHRIVLIQTSLFGFALFFVYGTILHGVFKSLLGALGGLSIMLAFYFLGIAFSKIIGKIKHQEIDEVAFGFGDVCLGTILGLLTGWPGIVGAVFVSMLAFVGFSFVYLLVLILLKQYRAFTNTLPFTFFLVLGAAAIFYL